MGIFWLLKPVAYFTVPFGLLCSVSTSQAIPTPIRYCLRAGIYLVAIAAASLSGIVVGIPLNLVGQRFNVNYCVARIFYYIASRALDITVEIEGEQYLDERPAILVVNHQSMVDLLFVGRTFPFRTAIMAKKSLQFTPLGPFMYMSGSVFVDRGNSVRARQSLEAAAASIKSQKVGLWVFVEGTRNLAEKTDLLPFKKGAFHLAIQAQIPIIPVIAENYWNIYHAGVFETGKIKVKVLPPIPTTGLSASDVSDLTLRTREAMLGTLKAISTAPTAAVKNIPQKELSPTPQPEPRKPAPTPRAAAPLRMSASKESLASSSSGAHGSRESGAETEEDEGMVLVGRPRD
ncbi:hypothetical protein DL96DRAFT_1522072 [Flagelloscypha sp. PMI_526]|nr:hypothetical protein DL96DRAFT_1522072 [Flagelloscypha sp. PMI_526]